MVKKKKESNTLRAFLETSNPERLIYIGAKNGSNWIIIDTPANIIRDIDSIEKSIYDRVKDLYIRAVRDIKRIPPCIEEVEKKLANTIDEKETKKLNKTLNYHIHRLNSARNCSEIYEKQLANWKPFVDRQVLDTYTHETRDRGTCVLIEGIDQGKFWTKNEYDKVKIN